MDDKVIVTNRAALKTKYGAAGVTAINTGLRRLIATDQKRGIRTRVLLIDDAAAVSDSAERLLTACATVVAPKP